MFLFVVAEKFHHFCAKRSLRPSASQNQMFRVSVQRTPRIRNILVRQVRSENTQKLVHTSRAFTIDMYTWATFFQLLKNPVFKTPLSSEVCPPPYMPPFLDDVDHVTW